MSARSAIPIALGALVLTASVAGAGYLLLQACALPLPLRAGAFGNCPTPDAIRTGARLQTATTDGFDLQRRIFELERELAARQCVKAPRDPNAPMTPEDWANRDLAMLFGCWSLDTTYRTRDVDTSEIRTYSEWRMCFDASGNGTQTMRADDGTVCEGTVQAEFAGTGGLNIIEPGNLTCADGSYIHRRQITCTQAAEGGASCDTLQPETNGQATVTFDRAPA